MFPTAFFNRLRFQCIVIAAVAMTFCSTAKAQLAEAVYNPLNGEVTINVIANTVTTLTLVGQSGADPNVGFVRFMNASSTTPPLL